MVVESRTAVEGLFPNDACMVSKKRVYPPSIKTVSKNRSGQQNALTLQL
jgi:hypothetical protein